MTRRFFLRAFAIASAATTAVVAVGINLFKRPPVVPFPVWTATYYQPVLSRLAEKGKLVVAPSFEEQHKQQRHYGKPGEIVYIGGRFQSEPYTANEPVVRELNMIEGVEPPLESTFNGVTYRLTRVDKMNRRVDYWRA